MNPKLTRLHEILSSMGNALIAYSGGVDSVFLCRVARDCLPNRVIALTALSPSFPSYEWEGAKKIISEIGIPHIVVESHELGREGYRANLGNRCYYCKTELYELCWEKARELGYSVVLNGTNLDDLGDYRPGLKAADEGHIRSPLVEAGMTKSDIREFSRELGLPTWDKQALACLSSRFPPGTEVTEERLKRIDQIESGLSRMGFRKFRVRFHEPIARIEVGVEEMKKMLQPDIREAVHRLCCENGFLYATLDLAGYRMGSLHQIEISKDKILI